MNIRNHHVGVNRQFGLKALLSFRVANVSGGTYVEDMKDPYKILFPRRNLALIALREDESMYRIPFTLLDDLLLNLG